MKQAILRPYKASKSRSNTNVSTRSSKRLKTPKKGVNGIVLVDSPHLPTITTTEYLKFSNTLFIFRRRMGLSSEAMDLLIYCYLVYVGSGDGINSMRVCKSYNNIANSEIQNVRSKLYKLEAKGYLVNIGRSEFGANLYIPSVSAINDIENVFSEK